MLTMKLNHFVLYRLGLIYFLIQLQFWFPIWIIFLLDKGLTLNEIIIADMLYWALIVILEVPMGYIGDRIGRKKTYFIGAICGSITFLIMTLINNLSLLIICWICWSIFLAIISGTDTAYIYEIIKEEKLINNVNSIFGYFASLASLAYIFSHFLAGFLYSINMNLPILTNAICVLAAGILIFSLPDVHHEEDLYSIPTFKEVIIDIAWKTPIVRTLMFILALLYAYMWTTTFIFQPFLLELGINLELFGLIYFAFTSLGVIGGLITGKLVKIFGGNYLIIVGSFGLWIAIGFVGFFESVLALVGIIFIRFFYFISESPIKVLINAEIDNKHRASIFSLANLISSILLLMFRPFIGYLSDLYNSKSAFQLWFLIGIIPFILIISLIRKIMKTRKLEI